MIVNLSVEFHAEFAAIFIKNLNVTVVSAYRSPSGDVKIFFEKLERVFLIVENLKLGNIVLCADLNIDITTKNRDVINLLNLTKQYGIYCINTIPTRLNSCLDNILTSFNNWEYTFGVFEPALSDHCAVWFSVFGSCSRKYDMGTKVIYPLKLTEIDEYIRLLNLVSWPCLLVHSEGTRNFEVLFDTLINFFELCFKPVKFRQGLVSKRDNLWFTSELKALRDKVIRFYNIFKFLKTDSSKVEYNAIKKIYRARLVESKLSYNETLINNASNKCKMAWSLIKRESGKGNLGSFSVDISADDFGKHFILSVERIQSDLGIPILSSEEWMTSLDPVSSVFSWTSVSLNEVFELVMGMSDSRSQDIYGFSNFLFRRIINSILVPLVCVINQCLEQGVFPDFLKISRTIPIYKKGDRNDANNYRPISLVPVLSKVFELVMLRQLSLYFESLDLLSDYQFGFRVGRSSTQAVELLVRQILLSFEDKMKSIACFCDLSKAFDCLPHDMILRKLEYYGVGIKERDLIASYLLDRSLVVEVNGSFSSPFHISFGVPQGSILGPFLFIVAINDLSMRVPNKVIMYADDTTFLSSSQTMIEAESEMVHIMEGARDWFCAHGLSLNVDKTQYLHFSLKSGEASEGAVKLLGFWLDGRLSWNRHTDELCGRLSRVIFLLRRLKQCVTFDALINAYYGFFNGIMSYGIIFWGNCLGARNVFIIQKRAIRTLMGRGQLDHCRPLFIELSILTLPSLFIYVNVVYVFKFKDFFPCFRDVHSHYTRGLDNIVTPWSRLSKSMNSHVVIQLKLYNKLPTNIRYSSTLSIFKKLVMDILKSRAYYSVDEFLSDNFEF